MQEQCGSWAKGVLEGARGSEGEESRRWGMKVWQP